MESLYHYTTAKGLMGIIKDGALHFTHYKFLNDPSESNYHKDIIKKTLAKHPECKDIYMLLRNKGIMNNDTSIEKYILSLSKNKDSLNLWRNYSGANGYCIEFEKASFPRSIFADIIYEEDEQIEIIKNCILKSQGHYQKIIESPIPKEQSTITNYDDYSDILCGVLLNEIAHFKNSAYKEEEEVRVIGNFKHIYDEEFNKYFKYKTSNNGTITEYYNLVSPDICKSIKSIKLHPCCNKTHQLGVEKFLRSQGFSNVEKMVSISDIPFRDM